MSTTTTSTATNGASSGARITELSLEPPKGRRVRAPELAVGVLVTVGFALAAVLWQLNAVQREPALALAADVARGEVLVAADVRVVYLASDDAIAHLGRDDAALVVGRVAVADLAAGTLLTTGQVVDSARVAAGEGVVGLSLEAGQFPSLRLRPGDVVNVVGGAGSEDGAPAGVVAGAAEVTDVEELAGQERRLVSLKLPERDANVVAEAAERGPVRLVLVGR